MRLVRLPTVFFQCLFVLILNGFISSSALASTFSVGTESIEYYPHYGHASQESKLFTGYARSVLDAFSRDRQITFEYHSLPIKRLYKVFLHDQSVDLKYPDNSQWQTLARKGKTVHYSEPVGYYTDGVMVRAQNIAMEVTSLKRLGTLRGFTPEPYLALIEKKKIEVLEFPKTGSLLRALASGRVDGAYLNVDVAKYQLTQGTLSGASIVFSPRLPYQQGSYRVSSIKRPRLIEDLNRFLEQNAPLLEELASEYGLTRME